MELAGILLIAFSLFTFFGGDAEGQTTSLDTLVRRYIEDRATASARTQYVSSLQMADSSALFSGTGGDGAIVSPAPSLDAPTLGESALMAITPPDEEYLDRVGSQRNQVAEYTVQEGDQLSFIASDFGVSTNSLIWANKLKDADSISPGQVLRIPPVSGIIHVVQKGDTVASLAKKYSADADRIIAFNRLPKDGILTAGDEITVPGGSMPGGVSVPAAAVGTAKPRQLAQSAKQFAHLPDLGGYFLIPTTGYDWGRIHGRNGVDIANSCGTPVAAAADGVVTVADGDGYNGGFGKYIKISHPNGTETLYAHSMKLLVSVGQAVSRGQKIMLMGTTGRSTGCHLHFEVHGAHNPLAK